MFCLFYACKKERELVNPQQVTITGQVRHAATNQPLSGIDVHMVRGTSCCAWIDSVVERKTVTTDSDGRYSVSMEYEKPNLFIRHMAFVPGYQSKFRLLPNNAGNSGIWHTTNYVGMHAYPESPTDTIPATAETSTDFYVLPGAWLNTPKSGKNVAIGETWVLLVEPDIQVAWQNGNFCTAGFAETYQFITDLRFPLVADVANKVSLIRMDLNNQVLSTKEFNFRPKQGDSIDFLLDF
jgi:hypothetical protein